MSYAVLPRGKFTDSEASSAGLSRLILTGWSVIRTDVSPDPTPTASGTPTYSFGIPLSEKDGLLGGRDELSGFIAPASELKKLGKMRVDARFPGTGDRW